jgi:hypothetical protein
MMRTTGLIVLAVVTCPMLTLEHAFGAEVEVVQLSYEDDRYFLTLEARIDASPAAVFTVITDYPSMSELHRRVKESRVVRRIDEHTSEVFTLLRGCIAFVFCKTVRRVERVVEIPPDELLATIIPEHSDFSYGRVRWKLTPYGDGTLLRYQSETEPKFWVPGLLGNALVARSLGRTVEQMIQRVEDRARLEEDGR